jgi:sporulation protein YlmC with PRC-barrel domain
MRINFQKLKSLPVETESGNLLGHIVDLEINLEAFGINKLEIQDKKWIGTDQSYLIGPEQIVKILGDKIIVQDNIKKIEAETSAKTPVVATPAATLNSEMER